MNIAILGFGLEGHAAYNYWHVDNDITICDENESLKVPRGVDTQLGGHYLDNLNRFDLVVRSPGIHPHLLINVAAEKMTSNVNEFMRICPSRNIIGVTGTKGKGTTSTLIAKMLEAAGMRVHLGGNIGVPALSLLLDDIQPDDYVVLELSSFQLIDLQSSPHVAVCLMVVPEHLDWHKNLEEYIAAKQQLFIHQSVDDIALYYAANENSTNIASVSDGLSLPYFEDPGAIVKDGHIAIDGQSICATAELKLLGEHNWQNVCAALTTVWLFTQDVVALHAALVGFTGLPYRLEFVRELNGVKYYNDSFGTTPETATVALQAFTQPKVIILGGSDKGADYRELAHMVASNNVRRVVLIGQQAGRIRASLTQVGYSDIVAGGKTMTSIVAAAAGAAQSGDVVLLSTGCASFDMFASYKDRGMQFNAAVTSLQVK
jgi:UDP-N-acetylmuramoylalanine--D-glutamate ligase